MIPFVRETQSTSVVLTLDFSLTIFYTQGELNQILPSVFWLWARPCLGRDQPTNPDMFGYVPDGKVMGKERHICCVFFAAPSRRGFLLPWHGRGRSMDDSVHDSRRCFRAQKQRGTREGRFLENRLSVVSIIVEDTAFAGAVNELLHAYGSHVVGRMGIPCKERGVSIICVVLDAPGDITSALSGKLGMLKGVSTKTIVAKGTKPTAEGSV